MAKTKSTKVTKTAKAAKTSKTTHKTGLFAGRLNRSGYVLGMLTIVFAATILGMIAFPLLSQISSGAVGTFLVVLFLAATIYSLSFSLRRLHDLNRSGWWLLLYLPGLYLEFIPMVTIVSSVMFGPHNQLMQNIDSFMQSTAWLFGILTLLNFLSTFFAVYLIVWPGYKKANTWGPPATHWKLKEILGFS